MPAAYHELRVSYPMPTSGEKIANVHPSEMWENFAKDGSHIGVLRSEKLHWHALQPGRPYVREGGIHFFVAPHTHENHQFINPPDVSTSEFTPIAQTMIDFLNCKTSPQSRTIVGYNMGEDAFRQTSKTWHNWHIHYISLSRKSLEKHTVQHTKELPDKLREPAAQILSDITQKWFSFEQNSFLQKTRKSQNGPFDGFPVGGVIIPLGKTPSASELASVLLDADTSYRKLHEFVFSQLVSNYTEAISSRGEIPFQRRDRNEVDTTLLAKLARVFQDRFDDPQHGGKNIITVPAYSVSLEKKRGDYYIRFAPLLFRTAGVMESSGIQLLRACCEESSVAKRQDAAVRAVRELGFTPPEENHIPINAVARRRVS